MTRAVAFDAVSKANATKAFLEAADKADAPRLAAGGAQSVAATATAGAVLAAAYAVGARTFGYDLKLGDQRVALEEYTAGRLDFESSLRAGEQGVRKGGRGRRAP